MGTALGAGLGLLACVALWIGIDRAVLAIYGHRRPRMTSAIALILLVFSPILVLGTYWLVAR